MQVFLPYPDNLTLSAESLDDKRLNKQITEINQILLTYVNKGGGHANHPVNQWYCSNQGINFLLKYLLCLTTEYFLRFNRLHMGEFTRRGLYSYFVADDEFFWRPYGVNLSFKPAYIKGSGESQIITTDKVGELYQTLLYKKWNDSSSESPRWTNRKRPQFF